MPGNDTMGTLAATFRRAFACGWAGHVAVVAEAAACLLLATALGAQQPPTSAAAGPSGGTDRAPVAATASEALEEPPLTEADRAHWAFVPLARPPLPRVPLQEPPASGIDAFIAQKLHAQGLVPLGEAPRRVLARRLWLDLVGLPPTPEELAAFETDTAPDAYERQVDRLLASPAFGEHFAQAWLDLARFAQTDGFEHDKVRPHAWRYRDWVIAALNADVPYDQFVRWQLAGDELGELPLGLSPAEAAALAGAKPAEENAAAARVLASPSVPPAAVPTMFCLAGPDMPDLNDQEERRHNLLNELTATVGSVVLGLQLGCAQCHDHKYDPLSLGDFYRLRAVFESAVPPLKRDVGQPHLAAGSSAAPPRVWIRGDHRRPGPAVAPGFPRIASPPHVAWSAERAASPRQALADWLFAPGHPLTGRVIANRLWTWHFGRGLCQTPSDLGVMGGPVTHPELLDWLACELAEHGWSLKWLHRQIVTSATYRRAGQVLEAQAEASAAVAAKRDVSTAEADSAAAGRDAARAAGRRAAASQIAALALLIEKDPENAWYGRFPRRRLEGETIRDAMLAASGLLVHESGGTGAMPPLPPELVGTLLKGQWTVSPRQADHFRRSIYLFARRNLRYPLFEAFDRPDANASCPLRGRSTTAPQALLMLNSELALVVAQHLAGRALAEAAPAERASPEEAAAWRPAIQRLYVLALARRPQADEVAMIASFLARQARGLQAAGRRAEDLVLPQPCPPGLEPAEAAAWVDVCLALLNSNEFIYVD
jgi:hypothetical protein